MAKIRKAPAPARTKHTIQSTTSRSRSVELPRLVVVGKINLRHYRMLNQDSGIADKVIRARGYCSIVASRELDKVGFACSQWEEPGLLIPIHHVLPDYLDRHPHAARYQYRPDKPRLDHRGKAIKYETPARSALCLDVSPHDPLLETVAIISLAFVLFLDAVKMQPSEFRQGGLAPILVLGPGTFLTIAGSAGISALLLPP